MNYKYSYSNHSYINPLLLNKLMVYIGLVASGSVEGSELS